MNKPRFLNDDERWRAVMRKDRSADGEFYFSVKSTGDFCRPSCAARLPKRENVRFHATIQDAQLSGFRACKRCRPAERSLADQQAQAVAQACRLIENAGDTPDLAALSRSVGLSPSHFHRIFKSLTGVTPKAYATALRNDRLRCALPKSRTVTSAAYKSGFNSNGRFYAASPKALGMTPKTYKAGGKGADIRFAVGQCSLGAILVAASKLGICAITLGDDPNKLVQELQDRFAAAQLVGGDKRFEKWVAKVIAFVDRPSPALDLPLDLQGTALQQRVWQALTKIPCGTTTTYTKIARRVGRPKAVRAVAQAIAANKIAVAIPCHRVVRTDGSLSGYRWGVERKAKLIEREREKFASARPLR